MKRITKFESPETYYEVAQKLYELGKEQEKAGYKAHAELYYKCAFECYEQAAVCKNVDAMYEISRFYDRGYGVKKSYRKSFVWAKKAAAKGHLAAIISLAGSYELGLGTIASEKKAVLWFGKAAEMGDAHSQYWMGNYYNCKWPDRDMAKAEEWYNRAAEQGNQPAVKELAKLRAETAEDKKQDPPAGEQTDTGGENR